MAELFQSKNRNPEKQIFSHITCATDKSNIKSVFEGVKNIVVSTALMSGKNRKKIFLLFFWWLGDLEGVKKMFWECFQSSGWFLF